MSPTKSFFVYFGAVLSFQISLLFSAIVLAGLFNAEVVIASLIHLYAPIFFLTKSSGYFTPAQGIGVGLFGVPIGMALYSAIASLVICRLKFRPAKAI